MSQAWLGLSLYSSLCSNTLTNTCKQRTLETLREEGLWKVSTEVMACEWSFEELVEVGEENESGGGGGFFPESS